MALEDRFEIEPPIHIGQIAAAYPAVQKGLGRKVLLKVIHPQWAGDAELVERFTREGRAMAQIDHPNVVKVFDFGIENEVPYLALEWVDGGTLKDLLRNGPLSQNVVKRLAADILAGLDAVHRKGLLHRDLKPDNILINRTGDGQAKLADFSLAGFVNQAGLTSHGALVGSPAYLAPELLDGTPASPASDLFSTGIILFEALTGSNPFAADELMAGLERLRKVVPPKLEGRPNLDSGLARLIDALLAKSPADRPAGAAEALAILNGCEFQTAPWVKGKGSSRRMIFITAAAAAVGLAIIIGLAGRQSPVKRRLTETVSVTAKPDSAILRPAPPIDTLATAVKTADTAAVLSKTIQTPPPKLKPQAPARLTLLVQPWANVHLDGEFLGVTPMGALELTPGEHHIRFEHESLPTLEQKLTLEPGASETLSVNLRAAAGRLDLSASPWGYLWVNGDSIGLLPRSEDLFLAPGTYLIEVRHPELPTWRDSINIIAGKITAGRVDLKSGIIIAN